MSMPTRIGSYRVLGALDRGGLIRVYRVEDAAGRVFALKTLLYMALADLETQERFRREVRIALTLQHPNLVSVIDWGVWNDNTPFVVTELMEGETAATLEGKRSLDEVRPILAQTLQGLAAIHAADVVHRSICPENLFLMRGGPVKILDFGLARAPGGKTVTSTGSSLGAYPYLSPEQVSDAKNVDLRTDLFSLGMVGYQLLSNQLPYEGHTRNQVLSALMNGDVVPIRVHCPELPEALERWLDRCLCPARDRRWSSASEALEHLPP